MTRSPETLRWLRVGLESDYMVLPPDDPECEGKHGVMDAECDLVALCESEEKAEIVADALRFYDREMWRRIGDETAQSESEEQKK